MQKFNITNLHPEQKKLRKRILEISHAASLSHLGSCFSAVDLIDGIYKVKKKDEMFILSNGHAGIAWYAVLEKYGFILNPQVTKKLHLHPDRNPAIDIHVSSGSLGQGLPIALGIALADRKKTVYCMLSDGECAEGSIWESLSVIYQKKVSNVKIVINANGWSAYDTVDLSYLKKRIRSFGFTIHSVNGHDPKEITRVLRATRGGNPDVVFAHTTVDQLPFLSGQAAHYYVMTPVDYTVALELLR
jgi:transketolase